MPTTRNTRPKGMPYCPADRSLTQFAVQVTEGQLSVVGSIQSAIASSPEALAGGFAATKGSAARAIFEAGINAKCEEYGLDRAALVASAQASYDGWAEDEDNADAAQTFLSARA